MTPGRRIPVNVPAFAWSPSQEMIPGTIQASTWARCQVGPTGSKPDPVGSPRAIVIAIACAGIAALAGAAAAATRSSSAYGLCLRLGKVVQSIPVGSSIGPWLVWDKPSCWYKVANSHPAAHKANVRKVLGGPMKIG